MSEPTAAPRRHPRLFWSAVAVAVLVVLAGAVVAYHGYAATSGPAGAVRGYFAALARSDAPDALAFGAVPAGPHTLLTSTVLREQQRIAPIKQFSVVSTRRAGSRATVMVKYLLAFADDGQFITDAVPVHEADGSWRLDESAIPTQLEITSALQRATIVGAGIPAGTVLLFPGAAPVRFQTPYLRLDAAEDHLDFGAGPTTQVFPEVSDEGKTAAVAAVALALRACLRGKGTLDRRCPQRNERDVPGSLRGAIVGALDPQLRVVVGTGDVGVLDVSGTVRVSGRYHTLSFRNRVESGSGLFSVPLHAKCYAVRPLVVSWSRGS